MKLNTRTGKLRGNGIDKDLNAVQVAIFSIYLTLLDYLDPPAIAEFKFPCLINENFFESDFFNEETEFNILFKDIKFDFIVGNPPWKGGGIGDLGSKYLKNRKKREKELSKKFDIAINNNEKVLYLELVIFVLTRHKSL